jgi:maltose phosphorylase
MLVTNEDTNWEEKFWEPLEVKYSNEAMQRSFKTHFQVTTLCKTAF